MLYLITFAIFLIWTVFVVRKGRITWHALLSIYFITVIAVDYGDVTCDYWLNLYDLPAKLLSDRENELHFGLIISDGMIFPLISIVFCFYALRFRRPWLVSLFFAVILGFVELLFFKLGFMAYRQWYHWTTPVILFFGLRLLARYADRLMYYSPPVSYRIRLISVIYTIGEWPDALASGIFRLYQFKPVLARQIENDPFLSMLLTTFMGVVAALLLPRLGQRQRIGFILGLGALSAIFGLWAHSAGLLLYNHWSDAAVVARYILPYGIIALYDRWEYWYTLAYPGKALQ